MTATEYRREAKRLHPDAGGSAEAFLALTERWQAQQFEDKKNRPCARPGCKNKARVEYRRDGKPGRFFDCCSGSCGRVVSAMKRMKHQRL